MMTEHTASQTGQPAGAKTSTEIIAGITTFLTMAYIIFVNADILSNTGMDKSALIAVTCLVSGIITIATGLLTKSPIAMAPGMGLNAFFAYSLVLGQEVSWQTALGIVFISGFIFLLLTIAGFRQRIVEAIPKELLSAIAVGIGVFITFIGMQNLGLIIDNPATLVSAGSLNQPVLIGLAGLLVMIILEIKKIKGSLLIGILTATVISIILGDTQLPQKVVAFELNITPIFAQIDVLGALKLSFIGAIFTMMFVDLFDSIGSILGLAQEADMVDKNGKIPVLGRLLSMDAIATMFGAFCGTSTTTTYIESASGISAGGRTGLTSITTGLLFLLAIIFVPLLAIVPTCATAPSLIMVGFFMMKNIVKIDFKNIEIGFPSFIIIMMIALSFSISTGLAFGFLSYSAIKIFLGKLKEIRPALWIINLLCIGYFIV
jgi:AGZA family xanthine/uracil permease-like MFS transporter